MVPPTYSTCQSLTFLLGPQLYKVSLDVCKSLEWNDKGVHVYGEYPPGVSLLSVTTYDYRLNPSRSFVNKINF